MEIKCSNKKCNAPLLKSYGATYKLRSRSIRWDTLNDTAVVQCNMCRSFNDIPLELKLTDGKVVLELGNEIKKSGREQLIVSADTKKSEKRQK
jgi:hypothetical protein